MTKRVSTTIAICMIAGIAAVAALFLPAKEPETAAPAPAASAEADTATPAATAAQAVNIENFSFSGATTVKPGEQITVSNVDGATHTMTANDGSFDTGIINGGEQATLTMPSTPGTYEYFCSLHPSMVATITVES